jgi:hypothetical protein
MTYSVNNRQYVSIVGGLMTALTCPHLQYPKKFDLKKSVEHSGRGDEQ